jgi:hypothetical protein
MFDVREAPLVWPAGTVRARVETLVGALIGSALTAVATWWVSARLDRQRSQRELHAAIGIVLTELEENSDRVRRPADDKKLKEKLTLGDWQQNKAAFAGLAQRPDRASLWEEVAATYSQISDFKFQSGDRRPSAENLHRLSTRLRVEQAELEEDLKAFSRPRWLRRGR